MLVALILSSPATAASGSAPISQTFKRVGGAVVVVRTIEHAPGGTRFKARESRASGLGSGVLISADGKVLTAAHVVQTADAVGVEFAGGEIVEATILASDPAADLALLQVKSVPEGVRAATLGDSDQTQPGDQIFVVGAPFGISRTLTVGYVSARRRSNGTFGSMESAELFQTDAAINSGNSGGPMFNLTGDVIGVVSGIVTRSGGSEGLGFAVTSNTARHLMIAEPTVWSGIEGYLLTGDLARAFNVPDARAGLLVQRVAQGSPAERLGLHGGTLPVNFGGEQLLAGGDIVLAVEGVALGAPNAYEDIRERMIEIRDRNSSLRVSVLRAGVIVDLTGNIDH